MFSRLRVYRQCEYDQKNKKKETKRNSNVCVENSIFVSFFCKRLFYTSIVDATTEYHSNISGDCVFYICKMPKLAKPDCVYRQPKI